MSAHRSITLGLTLCGLAAGVLLWQEPDAGTQKDVGSRPNVLFLSIDDLNTCAGIFGRSPSARTPSIDRLARSGTVFTNAHCSSPLCNPSRTAILTGIPPHRSGLYQNTWPMRKVMPEAVTIPEHFRANGYFTLGSGKVFHYPDAQSWDEYFPGLKRALLSNPAAPPEELRSGLKFAGDLDWGPMQAADESMSDGKVAAWAAKQLEREFDKPFFMALGFSGVHPPWFVPSKYFDLYDLDGIALPAVRGDDLDDVPEAGRAFVEDKADYEIITGSGHEREAVRAYLASASFVDAQIGLVLDALDASPYAENTIVVLWSDHGYHLGEKLTWRKSTLWEEATHVPLVIRTPGGHGDQRSDSAVSLLDLYPTLIDLCGLEARGDIAGESLAPLLRDPGARRSAPVLTTFGFQNHAIRSDDWRYIRYADGSQELYDHRRDPFEWNNLAGDPTYAGVLEELAGWLPEENAEPVHFSRSELFEMERSGKR